MTHASPPTRLAHRAGPAELRALYTRSVMKLAIDPDRSQIRIRTFAEGMFARLAHDLELGCRNVTGSGERLDEHHGSVTIDVPIAGIEVHGTVKHGRLDPHGLSSSDREGILEKMKKDVFHSARDDEAIHVDAALEDERAHAKLVLPHGKTIALQARVSLSGTGGAVRASGSVGLSLAAIGSSAVKGPMNAFRVKDGIEILFDLVFEATG